LALDKGRGRLYASATVPAGKNLHIGRTRGWVGPTAGLCVGEEKGLLSLPRLDPQTTKPKA